MTLGKRQRPPAMKRTTSVTAFASAVIASDLNNAADPNPRERQRPAVDPPPAALEAAEFLRACGICKRNLGPGIDTFIYRCFRVKERFTILYVRHRWAAVFEMTTIILYHMNLDLGIYMGDAAFCSLECREKQIKMDALKEKCVQMLRKSNASKPKARSKASGSGKTVAAA